MVTLLFALFATAAPQTSLGFDDQEVDVGGDDLWGPEIPWDEQSLEGFVVGGDPVGPGEDRWDATVGVIFNNSYVGCTGTLIAPKVVLTAAHCLGGVTGVIIGAKNWSHDLNNPEVEIIRTALVRGHPSYNGRGGADIGVLLLEHESSYEPRAIATDCVRDEYLENGAQVAVVGFGNTRFNGRGGTSQLHAGFTYIQDKDCANDRIDGIWTGCTPELRPGGELGAGGNDVDACFGDSGGPLFLPTDMGDFVAGVVARAYIGVPQSEPCRYGGIYVRPDGFIDWLEQTTGEEVYHPQCNTPPVAQADPIRVRPGKSRTTEIRAIDPDGDDSLITYQILEQPQHGLASVGPDGVVTYVAERGYRGEDTVLVGVVDGGHPTYERSGPLTTQVEIPVTVSRSLLGCSATSIAPVGSLGLLAGLLLLLRRRERAR